LVGGIFILKIQHLTFVGAFVMQKK